MTCIASLPGSLSLPVTYIYGWSPVTDKDDTLDINNAVVSNAGQYRCNVTAIYSGANAYISSSFGASVGYLTVTGK